MADDPFMATFMDAAQRAGDYCVAALADGIDRLVGAITSAGAAVGDKVSSAASSMKENMKHVLPESSPSVPSRSVKADDTPTKAITPEIQSQATAAVSSPSKGSHSEGVDKGMAVQECSMNEVGSFAAPATPGCGTNRSAARGV